MRESTPPPSQLDYAAPQPEPPLWRRSTGFIAGAVSLALLVGAFFAVQTGNRDLVAPLGLAAVVTAAVAVMLAVTTLLQRRERARLSIVAVLLAMPAISMVGVCMWAAAHTRPYGTSPRVKCASNLKQIGLALIMYANEHHGYWPASPGDLVTTEDLGPEVFVCPSSTDTPATGPTTQAIAANVMSPGHCSFTFAPGLTMPASHTAPNLVIAYEPATHHHDGGNVLYNDGHVEFQPAATITWIASSLAAGHNPPTTMPAGEF